MPGSPLRIAIMSTPRSGTTWLRNLLAEALSCHTFSVHHPDAVDWTSQPARTVCQLHWLPDDDLLRAWRTHGVRVVSIARHPLDVLVSILNFAQEARETGRWLGGLGGDEERLRGATPVSPEFVEYAESERAGALLSVTPAWWSRPGTVRVRYEQLREESSDEIAVIARELGEPVLGGTTTVTMQDLTEQDPARSFHFWRGNPGDWHSLLTQDVADRIVSRHRQVFDALGYDEVNADPALDPTTAERNWYELRLAAFSRRIERLTPAAERGRRVATLLDDSVLDLLETETLAARVAHRFLRTAASRRRRSETGDVF